MKAIICEICESRDFLKKDGVFVCQECGVKYSTSEIKALMVEVEDDSFAPATATAEQEAPAAESQRVANIKKLAERAREDNDSEMAAKYYEQLLLCDPDDWQARFYTTYYSAHNIKIAEIGASAIKVSNIIGSTFQMVKKIEDKEKMTVAYITIATDINSFFSMLLNNITPNLGDHIDHRRKNINNWVVPTIRMLVILGKELRANFPGEATDIMAKQQYDTAFEYSTIYQDQTLDMENLHNMITLLRDEIDEVLHEYDVKREEEAQRQKELELKKERELLKKKSEEYWAAHADEKATLESEKAELESSVRSLREELDSLCAKNEAELGRLSDEKEQLIHKQTSLIRKLEFERSQLGKFKTKEKKEITDRLNEIEKPKLTQLERELFEARNMHNLYINSEIKKREEEIRSEIEKQEKKLNKIATLLETGR